MNLSRFPAYLIFALAACGYLAGSNLRGWSLLMPFVPRPTALHGAPVRHK